MQLFPAALHLFAPEISSPHTPLAHCEFSVHKDPFISAHEAETLIGFALSLIIEHELFSEHEIGSCQRELEHEIIFPVGVQNEPAFCTSLKTVKLAPWYSSPLHTCTSSEVGHENEPIWHTFTPFSLASQLPDWQSESFEHCSPFWTRFCDESLIRMSGSPIARFLPNWVIVAPPYLPSKPCFRDERWLSPKVKPAAYAPKKSSINVTPAKLGSSEVPNAPAKLRE